MLDVLTNLMDNGEVEKCLHLAERQLLKGGYGIRQLAQIHLVICRCRLNLQDPYAAVPSGTLAVRLARDAGDWDLLARALLHAGTAYVGIRHYAEALQHFYDYFEHSSHYTASQRLEGAIWRHIGVTHQLKLESDQAIEAFTKARAWFASRSIDYSSFTVTHDLINTYLQIHDTDPDASLDPLPDLIKFEKQIVQKHPVESYFYANYMLDRASHYAHQGRFGRAIVCAMGAMEVRKEDLLLAFHCHMVLHRCTKHLGNAKQAFGYALSARMAAVRTRHFELEFVASQAMVEVVRQQGPDLVRQLDGEYQSLGIDLGQYLSPAVLRREQ